MEKARTGSRETRKAGILVQKRRIWHSDLRASDSRLSAKKSLHRRNWGGGFQDQSSRAVRCDPQADVAKVRPVQEKRMQQYQLSGLQHGWKRALPEYRCYLWVVCQLCHRKYIGEASRSAYTCGKEHLRALEQREQSSVMWRHSCEKHDGSVPGFTMNVTGMFQSDAMLRQISESIQINKVQQDQLINTKSEWSYFRIPRAVVTQSWDEATNILSYDYCTVKLNSSILLLLLKTFLWETWRWRPRLHNEWLLLFCQFYFSVIV